MRNSSRAKTVLSETERRILAILQNGLPIGETPYRDMAERAGVETQELLAVLRKWKRKGIIRRMAAVVNHFKVGLGCGAMVAWQVEPQHVEKAGEILAGFDCVSHVYERRPADNWPYNLYTMVHSQDARRLKETIQSMSRACEVDSFRVLITEKELKKTPPIYIPAPR